MIRQHEISRLEGFSDAVFGFALTLLGTLFMATLLRRPASPRPPQPPPVAPARPPSP